MKALSLWQPHATLTAIRAKKIESRPWGTNYRGPLAIHASKKFPIEAKRLLFQEPFYSVLCKEFKIPSPAYGMVPVDLPLGKILATCDLVACHKIDDSDWRHGQLGWRYGKYFWEATDQEKAFGDYRLGRYMWFLENMKQLENPIPYKGARLLFDVPDSLFSI